MFSNAAFRENYLCLLRERNETGGEVWDAVWWLHRVDEKWAAEGEEPGDAAMWQKREMAYIKMKWCFAKLDGAAAVLLLWGRGPTSKLFPETSARRQNGFQAVVRSSFQGDLLSVCSPKAQQYAAKVVSVFFYCKSNILSTRYFTQNIKTFRRLFQPSFVLNESYQKFWQRDFPWLRF